MTDAERALAADSHRRNHKDDDALKTTLAGIMK